MPLILKPRSTYLIFACLAPLLLGGCTAPKTISKANIDQPDPFETSPIAEVAAPSEPIPELSIFNLFASELAYRRGDTATAITLLREQAETLQHEPLFNDAAWLASYEDPNELNTTLTHWQEAFPESQSRLVFIAYHALRNNRFNEAIQYATKIENDEDAGHILQTIGSQSVNWPSATRRQLINYYDETLATRPNLLGLKLGRILASAPDNPNAAIDDLRTLHLAHPEQISITMALTGTLANVGDFDEAEQVLERSLSYRDDLSLLTQYQKVRYFTAPNEADITTLIAHEEETAEWALEVGNWLLARNALEHATAFAERLLMYIHHDNYGHQLLGRIELKRDDSHTAIAHWNNIADADILTETATIAANTTINSDHFAVVSAWMLEQYEQTTDDRLITSQLTTISNYANSESYEALTTTLYDQTKHTAALELLVRFKRKHGEDEAADELMLNHLLDNPNDHWTLNALAYSWIVRGVHYDHAEALLMRAITLAPEQGEYIDSLGWLMYKLNDLDAALEYLHQAAKLVEHPEILTHLAIVLAAKGEQAQSERILRAVHQRFPHYRWNDA